MTMVIDEWIKSAMADDSVAAELLFHMKLSGAKSQPTLPPTPPPSPPQPTVPSWGTRKRRTTPTVASRAATAAAVSERKNKADDEDEAAVAEDSTRCSPTTPLSWNGGASPSATADGCDESRSHTHNAARSKEGAYCEANISINTLQPGPGGLSTSGAARTLDFCLLKATATSEYTGNSASTKKCRKKKTFAELQEEESSLLKERMYLTKEIENKSANYMAQRARNENLKRIKLDLGSIPKNKQVTAPGELLPTNLDQPRQTVEPSSALTCITENDAHPPPPPPDSKATRTESTRGIFLLPDLNMMPSEDDSSTDVQCGTS